MIFAAETPQYFPPPACFAKMAHAEVFILADDLQFSKHARINRCAIKTAAGPAWLTVPVRSKGRFGQKINEVEITAEIDWRQKHWQTLVVNYCRAAYFEKYAEALESFFSKPWGNLADLNFAALKWALEVLQIDCRLLRGSDFKTAARGDERIAAWARSLRARVYLCDAQERERLAPDEFARAGIALKAHEYAPPVYHQLFGAFAPNLSILDLILNEGEESGKILRAAAFLE